MDEAFLSHVKERITAATRAVPPISHAADSGIHPALKTLEEWMTSYSPDAKSRCPDCKGPSLGGEGRICIACGRPLPTNGAATRAPFSFDRSLTKKRFYDSVRLEYRENDNTSKDIKELHLRTAFAGLEINANGYDESAPATVLGVKAVGNQPHGGAEEKIYAGKKSDRFPIPLETLNSKVLETNLEEENAWGCTPINGVRAVSLPQQFAEDKHSFPDTELRLGDVSAIHPAVESLGHGSPTETYDSLETSTIKPLPESDELDFYGSFPGFSNSAEPSLIQNFRDGELIAADNFVSPNMSLDLDDFFQGVPAAVNQSQTGVVEDVAPGLASIEMDLDGLFLMALGSGSHAQGHSVDTSEDFSFQTAERDVDDIFPAVSNSVNQSTRQDFNTLGSSFKKSGHKSMEWDLDDFFQQVPNSGHPSTEPKMSSAASNSSDKRVQTGIGDFFPDLADQPTVQGVETAASIPSEYTGQTVDLDYLDFFQTTSRPSDFSANKAVEPSAVSAVAWASGSHVAETTFDGFSQSSPNVEGQTGSRHVEPAALSSASLGDSSEQGLETEFDEFFQAAPNTANPSSDQRIEVPLASSVADVGVGTDPVKSSATLRPANVSRSQEDVNLPARNPVGESSGQIVGTVFHKFHAQTSTSANLASIQNGEARPESTVKESNNHCEEMDFDDFFQAAFEPANVSISPDNIASSTDSRKESGKEISEEATGNVFQDHLNQVQQPGVGGVDSSEKQRDVQHLEAEFDFYPATSRPAIQTNGPPVQANGQTGETAARSSVEDSAGQDLDADFDDFFQAPFSSPDLHLHSSVGHDFDDFFPNTSSSIEESRDQNGKADYHDFFRDGTKPANQGSGQTAELSVPDTSQKSFPVMKLDFDDLFPASSKSVVESLGQRPMAQSGVLSAVPPAEESLLHTSSMDFEDFVQAPPLPEDTSDQVLATSFDDFLQADPRSVNTSLGQEKKEVFEDFFQFGPQSVADSSVGNPAADFDFLKSAQQSVNESFGSSTGTDFDAFFQAEPPHGSGNTTSLNQNGPKTGLDSIFQAAPRGPASKVQPGQSSTTDFDFFQSAPRTTKSLKRPSSAADLYNLSNQASISPQDELIPASSVASDRSSTKGLFIGHQRNGPRNSSDNPLSGERRPPASGKAVKPDLSSMFSDYLVFDDKPQRNRR